MTDINLAIKALPTAPLCLCNCGYLLDSSPWLSVWCLQYPPILSKLDLFFQSGNAFWPCLAVLFHWQTAQGTAMGLSSTMAANFRLSSFFFAFFFFSCAGVCFKHSRRETEGRQDIPTQEEEMPAITCYASWTLKSLVLGGDIGEKPQSEWLIKH